MNTFRMLAGLLAVAALVPSTAAAATSVAYVDGHDVWLATPDGSGKFRLTTDGTQDAPWTFPAQAPDGRTIASHREDIPNGDGTTSRRPVLHHFGADGRRRAANLFPVYSGANLPVYPIGMDVDWDADPKGSTVAYGYSYCTFACNSTVRGYWLTFADHQSLYPTDPQGETDAHNPTFFGKRIVSSDSGGRIFVQPDVPEAPFTADAELWLQDPEWFLSRAEVARTGRQVAVEWYQQDQEGNIVAEGIVVGEHQGTVPSEITSACLLPTVGASNTVSISPDGALVAWQDTEGVKVAGAPNLAAGTERCTLSAPPVVISPTGRAPSLGGADVQALLAPEPGPGTTPPAAPAPPVQPAAPAPALAASFRGRATVARFRKGLKIAVEAVAAGRVSASATVPARLGRRLRVGRPSSLGFAAARRVVVARGSARAAAAGPVRLTLKPTRAARRAARRLRGKTLSVRVSQGASTATLKIRLR